MVVNETLTLKCCLFQFGSVESSLRCHKKMFSLILLLMGENKSSTSFNGSHNCTRHPFPQTHPFWVTRHCRRPSLRKMSTTISMGVCTVTVKGLRSKMLCSLTAGGVLGDAGRSHSLNRTADTLTTPSWCRRAFSEMIEWKLCRKKTINRKISYKRNTNPSITTTAN